MPFARAAAALAGDVAWHVGLLPVTKRSHEIGRRPTRKDYRPRRTGLGKDDGEEKGRSCKAAPFLSRLRSGRPLLAPATESRR